MPLAKPFGRLKQWMKWRSLTQCGPTAFALLVCSVLVVLNAVHVWVEQAEKETAHLALSLCQQAEDTLRAADVGIVGLVQRLEIDGAGEETLTKLRQIIMVRLSLYSKSARPPTSSDLG